MRSSLLLAIALLDLVCLGAGGCAPYQMVVEPQTMLLYNGVLEAQYAVSVWRSHPLAPLAEPPKHRLTPSSQPMSRCEQDRLIDHSPAHRNIDVLRLAAHALNQEILPDRQRFVLGSVPLILGFGAEPVPHPGKRPPRPLLVGQHNLTHRIRAAVIYPTDVVELSSKPGGSYPFQAGLARPPRGRAIFCEFREPVPIESAFQMLAQIRSGFDGLEAAVIREIDVTLAN